MQRPNKRGNLRHIQLQAVITTLSIRRRTHPYHSTKNCSCHCPIQISYRHPVFCHRNRRIYCSPATKHCSPSIKVYWNRHWTQRCWCNIIRHIYWPTITVVSCRITTAKMRPKNCPNTIWMLCSNHSECQPMINNQHTPAPMTMTSMRIQIGWPMMTCRWMSVVSN